MAISKTSAEQLITDNIDVWTSAIKKRGSQGRGSNKKIELYGIKKLRELILELAVRGLLVPQNPSDEPASVLLEKIAAEKEQLLKNKEIKKPKKLLPIADDEMVGVLPDGWEFVRLNDLGEWGAGATPRRGNSELYGGVIPWFKSGELVGDYISVSEETVTEEALKQASLRFNKIGDVLLAMYGATIGKTSILSVEATTNQAVCACTPFTGFSNIFLLTLLKAYKPRFIAMGAGGAQPNISREKIIATVVALPPEAEQPRIVAKVNELMALCDQLEQQTETSLTAHQTLVETLLNTLLTAAQTTPTNTNKAANSTQESSFDQAWNRIAQHFNVLFTTEHSIDQLKQTILQLAVMGKLVPQDPSDEPASVLLEKIAAEKEQLIKDKKIKKQKAFPDISEDEKPFGLPVGWGCCRLIDLIPQFQNGASSRGDSTGKNIVVLRLADIKNWKVSMEDTRSIRIEDKSIKRYSLTKGDVLIIRVNGSADIVGRFITCTESTEAIYCDHFIRMRFPIECYSSGYLSLLGSSLLIRNRISDLFVSTAGQKTVNQNHINSLIVTLPPLREQPRIVAKVNEFMALCDTLKECIRESQTTQLHLADAMAEQALN